MRVDRPCRWERASRRFRQRVTQSGHLRSAQLRSRLNGCRSSAKSPPLFEVCSSPTFVRTNACYAGSNRPQRSRPSFTHLVGPMAHPGRGTSGTADLPHPSANLVLGREPRTFLGLLPPRQFSRLKESGSAFGAKLQPRALRAFGVERPSLIYDKCAPAANFLAGPPLRRMSEDPGGNRTRDRKLPARACPQARRHSLKARRLSSSPKMIERLSPNCGSPTRLGSRSVPSRTFASVRSAFRRNG